MPYSPGDMADNVTRGRAQYAASRGDSAARAALDEYGASMRALGKATFGDTTDSGRSKGPDSSSDGARSVNAGRDHYRQQYPQPATTGDDDAA